MPLLIETNNHWPSPKLHNIPSEPHMLIVRRNRRVQLTHQRESGLCFLIVFLLFASYEGLATERVRRLFDQRDGLAALPMGDLIQDSDGFIWIGNDGGLFRFDGSEFRHWAQSKLNTHIRKICAGANGELFALPERGRVLYQVVGEDAEALKGPDGRPFDRVQDVAWSSDRKLWVAREDSLHYRNDQNVWVSISNPFLAQEKIRRLSSGINGDVFTITDHGVWLTNSHGAINKTLTDPHIFNLIVHPDGSLLCHASESSGDSYEERVLRFRDGKSEVLFSTKSRFLDFALRGQVLWAAFDRSLVAFRQGEKPEILGAENGISSGGPLLVDHEGTLWMGTYLGLFQFSEPETWVLNEKDGLPSTHAHYLLETKEGVWVSTWQGLGRVERVQNEWRTSNEQIWHNAELCADYHGVLWAQADWHYFFHRWNKRFIKHLLPDSGAMVGCSLSSDGTVWIASERGLFRTQVAPSPPLFVDNPFSNDSPFKVLEDSQARLWITSGESICHASVTAIKAGEQASWSCDSIKEARVIDSLLQMPDGNIWAATHDAGVWRYQGEEWKLIPASLNFPSRRFVRLVRSPSGGAWVLGSEVAIRVIDAAGSPEGWQIVEHLSTWQGLPSGEINDLIEEPDGSLWIAAISGVVRMPAEARRARMKAPRIKLVGLAMNGKPVDLSSELQIPPGHNQLEIHFAALSYRDRNLLKYQYRLHPDDQWTYSASNIPVFRFFDLRAGKYTAEVRASLDGVNWSTESARILFTVLTPWYLRWWSIALVMLLLGLVLYTAHRARVAIVLRLERQRTRIAMDLHDEIGSGLGSIGILSSVAASQSVDEEQRQEMSKRIAATAGELGTSLTDIVWSLRTEATTLESLASHLTRRAGSLFASDDTHLNTRFPDAWPSVQPSLTMRRNILLIAMESLHNVAKHAQATNVTLQFEQADGRNWLMQIEDDGCGLGNAAATNGSGTGMQSMKRRAAEIGAEITFTSKNGHGTIVSLRFNPQAKVRN